MTGDNLALTSDGLKYTPVAEGEDADGDQVMQAQPYGRKRLQDNQCSLYVRPSLLYLEEHGNNCIIRNRLPLLQNRKYERFASCWEEDLAQPDM